MGTTGLGGADACKGKVRSVGKNVNCQVCESVCVCVFSLKNLLYKSVFTI